MMSDIINHSVGWLQLGLSLAWLGVQAFRISAVFRSSVAAASSGLTMGAINKLFSPHTRHPAVRALTRADSDAILPGEL
jgi:hypothetical protein